MIGWNSLFCAASAAVIGAALAGRLVGRGMVREAAGVVALTAGHTAAQILLGLGA